MFTKLFKLCKTTKRLGAFPLKPHSIPFISRPLFTFSSNGLPEGLPQEELDKMIESTKRFA